MHRRAPYLFFALSAVPVGCSLVTNLDGLSGGGDRVLDGSLDTTSTTTADSSTDAAPTDGTGRSETSSKLPAGLIAYWHFENDSVDATGDPMHRFQLLGTAGFTAGIMGRGLDCPQGAQADVNMVALGASDMTFVAWVEVQGIASQLRTIFSKGGDWTNSIDKGPGVGLGFLDNSKQLQGYTADGTTWRGFAAPSTPSFDDAAFHMVAFVVDRAQGLATYLDGVLVGAGTASATSFASTKPLSLCNGGAHGLRGVIDEVMLFGRALTAAEIMTVKTSVQPGGG